jgi:ribosome-associated protein
MESKKLAVLCKELAENKKAENVVILDLRKVSSIADYFVVASGTSDPHLRAITEEIEDKLREDHGIRANNVDGNLAAAWMILDYFDVLVHVMKQDVRERFDLEGLWGDAPMVKQSKAKVKAVKGTKRKAKAKAE